MLPLQLRGTSLLGQVCSYWRRLVPEFAELWIVTNIVIPLVRVPSAASLQKTATLPCISTWISRSGVLPFRKIPSDIWLLGRSRWIPQGQSYDDLVPENTNTGTGIGKTMYLLCLRTRTTTTKIQLLFWWRKNHELFTQQQYQPRSNNEIRLYHPTSSKKRFISQDPYVLR